MFWNRGAEIVLLYMYVKNIFNQLWLKQLKTPSLKQTRFENKRFFTSYIKNNLQQCSVFDLNPCM